MWYKKAIHSLTNFKQALISRVLPYGHWINTKGEIIDVGKNQHESAIKGEFKDTANAIYRGNYIRIVNPGFHFGQLPYTLIIENNNINREQAMALQKILDSADSYVEEKSRFANNLSVAVENRIEGEFETLDSKKDAMSYIQGRIS